MKKAVNIGMKNTININNIHDVREMTEHQIIQILENYGSLILNHNVHMYEHKTCYEFESMDDLISINEKPILVHELIQDPFNPMSSYFSLIVSELYMRKFNYNPYDLDTLKQSLQNQLNNMLHEFKKEIVSDTLINPKVLVIAHKIDIIEITDISINNLQNYVNCNQDKLCFTCKIMVNNCEYQRINSYLIQDELSKMTFNEFEIKQELFNILRDLID